jgi:dienelactone hydrolase
MRDKIAIIGYCFGGLFAIDLARANPSGLKGAISVHGGLRSPEVLDSQSKIDASILVLHGLEDPVVPQETVLSFIDEMTKAEADFQIHCYGHAKHAFTFVGADIPEFGVKYNEKAHHRSEISIKNFLEEIF